MTELAGHKMQHELMNGYYAEQSVIGLWILYQDKKMQSKLASSIKPEYFASGIARSAHMAATHLLSQGKLVDIVLLLKELNDSANMQLFLAECAELSAGKFMLDDLIETMKLYYKARTLQEACSERITAKNVKDRTEEISKAVIALSRENTNNGTKSLSEITANQYARLFDKDYLNDRYFTGFPKLDGIMKGLYKKNLHIVAARPGVGKSIFALIWAINMAKQGAKVGFYSLEMSVEELYERLISTTARMNLGMIKDKEFGDNGESRVAAAADQLNKLPIFFNDDGRQTVESIKLESQIKKFDIVIVDYLQLLSSGSKKQNRNEEVSSFTRELKLMSMELDIPVIALSQLSRTHNENDEPNLSSLRDSGSIEQDASMVLFLWEDRQSTGSASSSYTACKVSKNRNGRKGSVLYEFIGGIMTFKETDLPISQKEMAKKREWQ